MSHRGASAERRWTRNLVVAASALVAVVAGAWSVVLPPGEGPDEPAHLGLVLHLADGNGYPAHDELHRTVALERLCTTFVASVRVCPLPGERVTATAVRVRGGEGAPHGTVRPAWDDAGGDRSIAELNQMAQHPPLYYRAMATALRAGRGLAGGPMALDRELGLLRLLNVLLVVPVPALAWATARRLGGDQPIGVTAALAAASLPMLTATGGVLNNDNLLTMLGAVAALYLACLAGGDRSRRTVVAAGVVIGLALLTKAFAVVLLPAVAIACWVGASAGAGADAVGDGSALRRVGERTRAALPPLAGVVVVAAVMAGWWYVRTWNRSGSPTPSVDADRYTEALRPPGFAPDAVHFLDAFAGRFAERFWGSFGWYSARLPGSLTVALTLGALLLVVLGLSSAMHRARLAVLLVPAVLLLAITAGRAWSLHARSGQYPFIQGRYLLAGTVGLAMAAAIGWRRSLPTPWSVPVLATLAVALQVGSLLRGLTTYWSGSPLGRIAALDAWSGLPDTVPSGLVAAAMVGSVVVLAIAWRSGMDQPCDGGPVPSASR